MCRYPSLKKRQRVHFQVFGSNNFLPLKEARFHFLCEQVNNGKLQLLHCSIEVQVADILTKALKKG